MEDDVFYTIESISEGYIIEKKSKFISFAIPINSLDEVKNIIATYNKKYYDARHVCWAYMIGPAKEIYRVKDDGEPSGTAGKPILGQIKSNNITNVIIIVVRYFGGILLGTSGLINSYKKAAADAIANGNIIEKKIEDEILLKFDYQLLNEVMRVLKQFEYINISQIFEQQCIIKIKIRKTLSQKLKNYIINIHGVDISIC